MKNMRIPTRPAPSNEEARRKYNAADRCNSNQQNVKKKPPPRPPPPDFSKMKSKSTLNLLQPTDKMCLIEWSPPGSPKSTSKAFGGSISSSFSSSTSSLASSKKSFEYDASPFNICPWSKEQSTTNFTSYVKKENQTPQLSVPTIIRAQQPVKRSKLKLVPSRDISPVPTTSRDSPSSYSPPMPSVPPPSPPKEMDDNEISFGIALYNFPGTQIGDLPLQENDIVLLLRRVNSEWLYGRIDDREGIFPANFLDIQVPLPEDDKIVTALYAFQPQMKGDLALKPGHTVKVSKKISDEWLYGESDGLTGQFPSNFVDRIPTGL